MSFMESPFFGASGLLRYIGLLLSGVCHQFPEHSYFIAGVQLPLCARCTGTYLGALLGLCASWWRGRSRASQFPPRNILILMTLFFAFWALDGLNSYYYFLMDRPALYTPNNLLRLTAGMVSGLSLSLLVMPMFTATLWRKSDDQRIINTAGELLTLLLSALILEWLVQANIAVLLYPLLLASVLSVLTMLTIVNTTILVLLFHREQRSESWREARLPLSLGLVLSIVEIGSLALLRHLVAPILSTAPW
jgi:uncharacterized membrane protein